MPVHARFCWYLDFEHLTSILSWTRNLLTLTQTETERTTSLEQMAAGDSFTERMKWKELLSHTNLQLPCYTNRKR